MDGTLRGTGEIQGAKVGLGHPPHSGIFREGGVLGREEGSLTSTRVKWTRSRARDGLDHVNIFFR